MLEILRLNIDQIRSKLIADNLWVNEIKIYDENNFHEKPCHIFNFDEIGTICDQGICLIISLLL